MFDENILEEGYLLRNGNSWMVFFKYYIRISIKKNYNEFRRFYNLNFLLSDVNDLE